MKRPERHQAKTLLGEFSRPVGSETLRVRVYRDRGSCVCERELIERDGTSFTMVIPFREVDTLKTVLSADPHYSSVSVDVGRVLGKVDRALRDGNGDAET